MIYFAEIVQKDVREKVLHISVSRLWQSSTKLIFFDRNLVN